MHIFDISDWRIVSDTDARIVYRPGSRTVVRRLGATLIAAILLGSIYWGIGLPKASPPQSVSKLPEIERSAEYRELREATEAWALEAGVTPEEIAELDRARRERSAARHAEYSRILGIGNVIHWIVFVLVGLLGVLPPLACLWNRVALVRDPWGNIEVRTCTLWPRRHTFNVKNYSAIRYGARERVTRDRYGTMTNHFWIWFVQLAEPGGLGSAVEFYPHRQKDRPGAQPKPPERVILFINWLYKFTQLPVTGPDIMEERSYKRGFFGSSRTLSAAQPVVTRHQQTFNNLDEMPADLRAQAEQMIASGQADYQRTESIRVRNADGTETVYNSPDEMPAEIRDIFERAKRDAGH